MGNSGDPGWGKLRSPDDDTARSAGHDLALGRLWQASGSVSQPDSDGALVPQGGNWPPGDAGISSVDRHLESTDSTMPTNSPMALAEPGDQQPDDQTVVASSPSGPTDPLFVPSGRTDAVSAAPGDSTANGGTTVEPGAESTDDDAVGPLGQVSRIVAEGSVVAGPSADDLRDATFAETSDGSAVSANLLDTAGTGVTNAEEVVPDVGAETSREVQDSAADPDAIARGGPRPAEGRPENTGKGAETDRAAVGDAGSIGADAKSDLKLRVMDRTGAMASVVGTTAGELAGRTSQAARTVAGTVTGVVDHLAAIVHGDSNFDDQTERGDTGTAAASVSTNDDAVIADHVEPSSRNNRFLVAALTLGTVSGLNRWAVRRLTGADVAVLGPASVHPVILGTGLATLVASLYITEE
jgi:hypothetical protein